MIYPIELRKKNICPTCRGECMVKVGNLREMHNHDTETCGQCGGTGKLKRTVTIKYERI
jgi:DnaJ-class molecular chaperone